MTRLRPLIDALGEVATRAQAARSLAQAVGARELLLFVTDPELGVVVPSPGMPQTLRAASRWQALLQSCSDASLNCELEVDGAKMHVCAAVVRGCGFILVAETLTPFPGELVEAFPLLAAAQIAQQALLLEKAAAADARKSSSQAHELAQALEAARMRTAEINRQLQTEHEQKDQFLAMLAHELRNPLAPVSSAVEVLRRIDAGHDARVSKQLDVMSRQLQQLTHLVDDLLDISRVSRGLIELRREPLALRDLLGRAVESARPLIQSRAHSLSMDAVAADNIYVDGDAVRLTQVFANLLNNAAKYTAPGGKLRINVKRQDHYVEVDVSDNGSGIPTDMLESIFDLFTQVPGSLDRAPGGLGIGLTLVRTLVRLHGGEVEAHSDGPGTGSVFSVKLPLVQPPPVSDRTLPANAGRSGCATVMIVDDNVDAAQSLAEVLRLLGTSVVVAHDGAQALAIAAAEGPAEVVLLDIGLPELDGYEVAREWRRRFGRASRLIALTGYGSADDRRRTAQAGFDAHLVKPVGLEQLLETVAASATNDC
jgi:signal transduction histidine kinase